MYVYYNIIYYTYTNDILSLFYISKTFYIYCALINKLLYYIHRYEKITKMHLCNINIQKIFKSIYLNYLIIFFLFSNFFISDTFNQRHIIYFIRICNECAQYFLQ